MNNIMPVLEVKAKRIGGATYQVPIEVKAERRQALALRWLTMYSRQRGERHRKRDWQTRFLTQQTTLVHLLRRKEDMHKMAEANKAFAHYRSFLQFILLGKNPWLEENIRWREPEISELWLISMPVKRPH